MVLTRGMFSAVIACFLAVHGQDSWRELRAFDVQGKLNVPSERRFLQKRGGVVHRQKREPTFLRMLREERDQRHRSVLVSMIALLLAVTLLFSVVSHRQCISHLDEPEGISPLQSAPTSNVIPRLYDEDSISVSCKCDDSGSKNTWWESCGSRHSGRSSRYTLQDMDETIDNHSKVIYAAVCAAVAYRDLHGSDSRHNFVVCDAQKAKRDDVCFLLVESESSEDNVLPVTSKAGQDSFVANATGEATVIDSISGKPVGSLITVGDRVKDVWTKSNSDHLAGFSPSSQTRRLARHSLQFLADGRDPIGIHRDSSRELNSQFIKRFVSQSWTRPPTPQGASSYGSCSSLSCIIPRSQSTPLPQVRAATLGCTYRSDSKIAHSKNSARLNFTAMLSPRSNNDLRTLRSAEWFWQLEQGTIVADRLPCVILMVCGTGPIYVIIGTGDGSRSRRFELEESDSSDA